MLQRISKILHDSTKTQCRQTNTYIKKKYMYTFVTENNLLVANISLIFLPVKLFSHTLFLFLQNTKHTDPQTQNE